MGEIAEMMLDGTLCAGCGVFLNGDGDGRPPYYRVYPDAGSDYYECASPRSIAQYFTIEEIAS